MPWRRKIDVCTNRRQHAIYIVTRKQCRCQAHVMMSVHDVVQISRRFQVNSPHMVKSDDRRVIVVITYARDVAMTNEQNLPQYKHDQQQKRHNVDINIFYCRPRLSGPRKRVQPQQSIVLDVLMFARTCLSSEYINHFTTAQLKNASNSCFPSL